MKKIILVMASALLANCLMAQINYQPQTIKVKGSAETLVAPNVVHLIVDLKEVNERNVQIPMLKARQDFIAICKATKVDMEDVKMSNANSELEQKLSLWRKTRTEVIQREQYDIKFTDMNKMLNYIQKLDQPFVESLRFGEQTHTEIIKYRKEVKENAAKAAIEKARYLAIASGRELGEVIFIEEVNEINQQTANQYSNQVRYKKAIYGGDAKVDFGFKPIALRYEVLVICKLK